MQRALGEYVVAGIKTTVPFFTWLLQQPEFHGGDVSHDVSRRTAEGPRGPTVRRAGRRQLEDLAAVAAALQAALSPHASTAARAATASSVTRLDRRRWKTRARSEGLR